MGDPLFFENWRGLARVVVLGTGAYLLLLLMLRASGKRTLSKMNAFDFVVTVALGSTLATILLSRNVVLAEGAVALGLLIGLQFVVTWLSVRSHRFQMLVKAQPRLLFHKGAFIESAMRAERVTREEILAAARSEGWADLDEIESVVLETDGTLSIIGQNDGARPTVMNVRKNAG
jgi:uncharacterized membrane protein YcaP (DUF421 family)